MILYSFRRCPYAMRARMAVDASGLGDAIELREIILKNKPAAMLEASPKGTVPVLVTDTEVISESLEIMTWALSHHDPEGWLENELSSESPFIEAIDGPFKRQLDHYKYAARYDNVDPEQAFDKAITILAIFEKRLTNQQSLAGQNPGFSDVATFPFIRQFSSVDPSRFAEACPNTFRWLQGWLQSPRFRRIMAKHPPWHPDYPPLSFSEAFV